MRHLVRTSLIAAVLLPVACGWATTNRNVRMGSGPDACWESDSACHSDKACCSNWCVNGVCEYRP
jgi:hypothetical protein